MPFKIVEIVTDPERAAEELADREAGALAQQVRERGKGVFPLEIPGVRHLPAHDRDRAMRELARVQNERGVGYGMRHCLRTDFDPDWSKQTRAARAALVEVLPPRERSAVSAVNTFERAYFDYGPEWNLTDRDATWPPTDARNFRDGALILANAIGGLSFADGEMSRWDALSMAATLGWDGDPVRPNAGVRDEAWLACSLGRVLRQCGDGRLEDLILAFERGCEGHN